MATIEVKTDTLDDTTLDYCVAMVEGLPIRHNPMGFPEQAGRTGFWIWEDKPGRTRQIGVNYSPSTNWAQGGPLIGEYKVEFEYDEAAGYCAMTRSGIYAWGSTHLIAAMRCLVAAEFGDTVQVPEELVQ